MCSIRYMQHKSMCDAHAVSIVDAEKIEYKHPRVVINPRDISKGRSKDL
jgi:hypothetical protein